MMKIELEYFVKSLVLASFYVGFATYSIINIETGVGLLGYFLTLPVSVLTYAIVFTEPNFGSATDIIVIQSIVFFIFWFALYKWLVYLKNPRRLELKRMKMERKERRRNKR